MQRYVRNFEGMPVPGLLFAKAIQNIQEKGIRPKGGFKNSLALVPEIISSTIIFLSWNKKHIITTSSPKEGYLEEKQSEKEQKES